MSHQTIFLTRLCGLFMAMTAAWTLVDEPGWSATAQALVNDRPAILWPALILTYAGLGAPPIVVGGK